MGHIFTKAFDADVKSAKRTVDAEQPCDIQETPVLEKKSEGQNYSFTNIDDSPFGTKCVRNVKLDPRSPTVGIYRTPIVIETANLSANTFDSPVSIYSSNFGNSDIQDIMTPLEPSVNVSGYSDTKDFGNDCTPILTNVEFPNSGCEKSPSIKVRDKPSTAEAKKLLEEISMSEHNFLKKGRIQGKKEVKGFKVNDDKAPEFKVNALRSRTPLSNITSSGNSPSPLVQSRKILNKRKPSASFGLENDSPVIQHFGHWDTNNTVII